MYKSPYPFETSYPNLTFVYFNASTYLAPYLHKFFSDGNFALFGAVWDKLA